MQRTEPQPSAAAQAADVILRDGTTLQFKAPAEADLDALVAFFGSLSERSRYLRFHGSVRVGPHLVTPVLDPDWTERGAFIALRGGQVVALACYVRLRARTTAEVAFAVSDTLQGKGVGTRLLEQLAARASAAGIDVFVAEVLRENGAMLEVFEHAGFEVVRELDSGTIEARFSIAPTERHVASVDLRDHAAVVASLRSFFEPASMAVIGASTRRGSIGSALFRNIRAAAFTGATYPVNLRGGSVAGVPAYASVADIPERVELAILCVPAAQVLAAAEVCLQRGIRALCVVSSGFAEAGDAGAAQQLQLLELVRANGGRLIGPNSLGIAAAGVQLNATVARIAIPFGRLGLSSQSGALGMALIEAAHARGLGFSSFVAIGNKADVSSNDLLEWWEDDDRTDLVLLYLESFGNPRKFGRIARRVARSKPILVLKSGRSPASVRGADSRTAALAGSEVVVDALFRHAGVLRAQTLDEFVDLAALLYTQPLPRGRRVALLTNARGPAVLCADAAGAAGLELAHLGEGSIGALAELLSVAPQPGAPVNVPGANAALYEAILPVLLADPHVDAVIALFVPPVTAGADEVAAAINRAAAAAASAKPVLAVLMQPRGAPPPAASRQQVALFRYPESAARALGRAAERAEWLRRPAGTAPTLDGIDRARAETLIAVADDGWLEPDATRALLRAYGISLVEARVVDDIEGIAAAARDLGFPLVVKSAVGAHKTQRGAVALDLREEAEVVAAARRIGLPVILQPYVRDGVEMLAGLVQDPVFGPLVAFGPGGVLAELIGEANFRIAPLTDVDARELVDEGKAGTLVRGFRRAPADADALIDLVLRLSRMADEIPEVAEVELNPVQALGAGCVAVDAQVRVRRSGPAFSLKSW
ncbi:MAG: GNAT family N-acetyltransferase [Betaproteobacteria bacterium]